MTDIKIKQGAVITIELPGLHAIRINTVSRTIAVDGISGSTTLDEPCAPDWTLLDLQHGTYGDFHRLRPASECGDAECCNSSQHITHDDTAPCLDCGAAVNYVEQPWHAVDGGGVCVTCGQARGLGEESKL